MIRTIRGHISPGYLAVCLSAATTTIFVWGWSTIPFDATSAAEPGSENVKELETVAQPVSGIKIEGVPKSVIERPLLRDGRRDAPLTLAGPAETTSEVAPVGPAESVSLVATPGIHFRGYLDTGSEALALLVWAPSVSEEWRAVGYEQDGWRLDAISSNEVLVRNGGRELTFRMYGRQ